LNPDQAEFPFPLAIGLVALIGAIDVIAIAALGTLYAGAMAANTARLAIAIGGNWDDAILALSMILAFVAGVVIASLLILRDPRRGNAVTLLLMGSVLALCAAIAKPYWASPMPLLAIAAGFGHTLLTRLTGQGGITAIVVEGGRAFAAWLTGDGDAAPAARAALLFLGAVGGALIAVGLYWRVGLLALWTPALIAAALGGWMMLRQRAA
jgi:uncharacterized membrane protein YoaK (UPF0700 family)